jgi:hypothetical protein
VTVDNHIVDSYLYLERLVNMTGMNEYAFGRKTYIVFKSNIPLCLKNATQDPMHTEKHGKKRYMGKRNTWVRTKKHNQSGRYSGTCENAEVAVG